MKTYDINVNINSKKGYQNITIPSNNTSDYNFVTVYNYSDDMLYLCDPSITDGSVSIATLAPYQASTFPLTASIKQSMNLCWNDTRNILPLPKSALVIFSDSNLGVNTSFATSYNLITNPGYSNNINENNIVQNTLAANNVTTNTLSGNQINGNTITGINFSSLPQNLTNLFNQPQNILESGEKLAVMVQDQGSDTVSMMPLIINVANTPAQAPYSSCRYVILKAPKTNTGVIYIGGSGISLDPTKGRGGFEMAPGDIINLKVNHTDAIWYVGANVNDCIEVLIVGE